MSVYTSLQRHELEAFLASFQLGKLVTFEGISEGTENSNFFVSLERGEFVLTLLERGSGQDLPLVLELLDRLHDAGLPVPYALKNIDSIAIGSLRGKPALLQPRLNGRHVLKPNPHHCQEVGHLLARLHVVTTRDPIERPSDRGLDWMLDTGKVFIEALTGQARHLLQDVLQEIEHLQRSDPSLPRANLHADLFRDNVLFEGSHLTGVIDFYNACSGWMLYDIAITVNDWCSQPDGQLDQARTQALLAAYAAKRPFTAMEATHWPALLRIACLRFWLSRLIAAGQDAGQNVLVRNPHEFQMKLEQRQQVIQSLPLAL